MLKKLILLPAAAVAISALTGCSTPVQTYYADLDWNNVPNKTEKPAAQWSDALTAVEKGMIIMGVKDASRSDFNNAVKTSGDKISASGSAADLALGLGGFANGNNAAGAMGLGLWLVPTGHTKEPNQLLQIAAWVPESEASNFYNASERVSSEWNKARQQVFTKSLSPLRATPAALPNGDPHNYASLADSITEQAFKLDKIVPAKPRPDFLPTGRYYGPIFLTGAESQIINDEKDNSFKRGESYIALSKALPSWMVIYDPGYQGDRLFPARVPAVYREGKQYLFVEKQ